MMNIENPCLAERLQYTSAAAGAESSW